MIDWETRTIEVPQFLSVRFDHNSELVYFGTPRYFEGMDLADMVCVIQYINPAQEKGLYFVPYYDIDHTDENGTPLLVIPWVLGGLATIKSGKITFNIRFYKINYRTKQFMFNLSTSPAIGEIMYGLDLPRDVEEQFRLDATVAEELYQTLFELAGDSTTMWLDV